MFLLTLLFYWVCFSLYFTLFHDAPFVPLKKSDVEKLVTLFAYPPNAIVYDLGSGNASNLIALTRRCGTRGVGIEKSSFLCFLSRWRIRRAGMDSQIRIHWGNFMKTDIHDANYVVCYLFPEIMQKLKQKFLRELRSGSIIISFSFPMRDLQLLRVEESPETKKKIFIYQIT